MGTRRGRRGCRAEAVSCLALLALAGCAFELEPGELGPVTPVAGAYSRNAVVCAPTSVGNVLGAGAGAVLASPFAALADLFSDDASFRVVRAGATGPAVVLGAALGTLFLPFSYLAKESRCWALPSREAPGEAQERRDGGERGEAP